MDTNRPLPWTVRGRVDAMVERMSTDDAIAVRDRRRDTWGDRGAPYDHHLYHWLAPTILRERPHLREPFASSDTGQGRVLCLAAGRVLDEPVDLPIWRVGLRRPHDVTDPMWSGYLADLDLVGRHDVCSIDGWVCPYGRREPGDAAFATLAEVERYLPHVDIGGDDEYALVFVDADVATLPVDHPALRLVGYDLSDETHTSSLLNCGPWHEQGLGELAVRRNERGLLDRADAYAARDLLPIAFFDDYHGWCTVWALFEATVDLAQPTP